MTQDSNPLIGIPQQDLQPPHRPLAAQIFSDIFSPILVPTIAMATAMWGTTVMSGVPGSHRLLATLLVFAITGIAPLLAISAMIRLGLVSDRAISRRDQRSLPMAIAAACYFGAAVFVGAIGAPSWIRMFFVGASAATLIALGITQRWKISAHTTAIGGLAAMMAWISLRGMATAAPIVTISCAVMLCGAMATCRLLLRRHTPAQTMAGLALGCICCLVAMLAA